MVKMFNKFKENLFLLSLVIFSSYNYKLKRKFKSLDSFKLRLYLSNSFFDTMMLTDKNFIFKMLYTVVLNFALNDIMLLDARDLFFYFYVVIFYFSLVLKSNNALLLQLFFVVRISYALLKKVTCF